MFTKLLSLVLLVAQAQSLQVLIHSSPVFSTGGVLDVYVTLDDACPAIDQLSLSLEGDADASVKCIGSLQEYICSVTFSSRASPSITVTATVEGVMSNSLVVYNYEQAPTITFLASIQDNCDPFPMMNFVDELCRFKFGISSEEDLLAGPGMFKVQVGPVGESTEAPGLLIEQIGTKEFELSFLFYNINEFTVTVEENAVISSQTGRGNAATSNTIEIVGAPEVKMIPVPYSGESPDMCAGKNRFGENECSATWSRGLIELRVSTSGCGCDQACIERGDCCQMFFSSRLQCCVNPQGDDTYCQRNKINMKYTGPWLTCNKEQGDCDTSRPKKAPFPYGEYTCRCDDACFATNSCCGGTFERFESCS